MNLKEAYKVLEVKENISDEDLRKHYRSLSKLYHPDVYKEDPEKFKRINEAYQFIQENKNKKQDVNFNQGNPFSDFNVSDFFNYSNSFATQPRQQIKFRKNPSIEINISFKDSVIGCTREIKYSRYLKCNTCNGSGVEIKGNGCGDCDGFGRIISRNGNMVYTTNCKKCLGHNVKRNNCKSCLKEGSIKDDVSLNINVPPGVEDKNKLRLQGMGNFSGQGIFGDDYSDVFVCVNVEKNLNFKIENKNVVSNLNISLLNALKGQEIEVETMYGNKKINIIEKSRNKDEILVPGCGLNGTDGNHKFILNVEYPQNINDLIKLLEEQKCLS